MKNSFLFCLSLAGLLFISCDKDDDHHRDQTDGCDDGEHHLDGDGAHHHRDQTDEGDDEIHDLQDDDNDGADDDGGHQDRDQADDDDAEKSWPV